MSEIYLVRAGVEFEFKWQEGVDGNPVLSIPHTLPMELGPFNLDQSPNAMNYLTDLGWIEEGSTQRAVDHDYPLSFLYVEGKIDVREGQHPEEAADDMLEQLESVLRLFQKGDVCLRRDPWRIWRLEGGVTRPEIFLWPRKVKPMPAALYSRGPYSFDDADMGKLADFFNCHWAIIHQKPQPLYSAIWRFSSSYERRTLPDRLVELMISMEALFGDKDYHRYKIPLRCSCMLFPPGGDRKKAFEFIRRFYDERSALLHGGTLELKPEIESQVDEFEEYVRKSILRFLEWSRKGRSFTRGVELDDFLFFTE